MRPELDGFAIISEAQNYSSAVCNLGFKSEQPVQKDRKKTLCFRFACVEMHADLLGIKGMPASELLR